jgi:hypothetical protein
MNRRVKAFSPNAAAEQFNEPGRERVHLGSPPAGFS